MGGSGSDAGDRTAPAAEAGLTRVLRPAGPESMDSRQVLLRVYRALQEKGYDPVGQIAHYLLSGEPTFITAHQNARALITCLERDDIIRDLVRTYIRALTGEEPPARRA